MDRCDSGIATVRCQTLAKVVNMKRKRLPLWAAPLITTFSFLGGWFIDSHVHMGHQELFAAAVVGALCSIGFLVAHLLGYAVFSTRGPN